MSFAFSPNSTASPSASAAATAAADGAGSRGGQEEQQSIQETSSAGGPMDSANGTMEGAAALAAAGEEAEGGNGVYEGPPPEAVIQSFALDDPAVARQYEELGELEEAAAAVAEAAANVEAEVALGSLRLRSPSGSGGVGRGGAGSVRAASLGREGSNSSLQAEVSALPTQPEQQQQQEQQQQLSGAGDLAAADGGSGAGGSSAWPLGSEGSAGARREGSEHGGMYGSGDAPYGSTADGSLPDGGGGGGGGASRGTSRQGSGSHREGVAGGSLASQVSGRSERSVGKSGGGGRDGAGSSVGSSSIRSGGSRAGSSLGGGGGGSVGGGGARVAAPAAGRLTFFGWWYEDVESTDLSNRVDSNSSAGGGLAPRHCTLQYDFASRTYTFSVKDPVPAGAPHSIQQQQLGELRVPGIPMDQVRVTDTNRPADVWDLHLGARLRLLGRAVELKNADLATQEWHAGYCRQLVALRDQLAQEIQKYKPRALRSGLLNDKGSVKQLAGQQLRHMAGQVRALVEDLRQYRPSKADGYLAALPVAL